MPDDATTTDATAETAAEATTTAATDETSTTAATAVDEPLGEGGKKALDAERTARKTAEAESKKLKAELDELRTAQMSDQEKAVAEARKAGETEATTKVQSRIFAAEAKVAAAGKLTDPALLGDPDVALRLLGFTEPPVDAAGDIDSEAISKAIDKLVEDKPYLAGTNGGARPSPGSADGGARGTADGAQQLTREDLKTMSPEAIVEAKAKGQLKTLLGG